MKEVFNILVDRTERYLLDNNLQAMILGISGGIDSTVVAAIGYEVNKRTGIPLIGRSLPIRNKQDEFTTSKLVGKAFCNDFKVKDLQVSYTAALYDLICEEDQDFSQWEFALETSRFEQHPSRTPIANGNLQARCRMKYLYDLAGRNKGCVLSTDNQTEYQLGFWTLHGDVGDFNPLFGLWKTEVYKLAEQMMHGMIDTGWDAIRQSMELTPTDGLGISNSDLEQIGASSYNEVDPILKEFKAWKFIHKCLPEISNLPLRDKANMFLEDASEYMLDIDVRVIKDVIDRHVNSEFKRKNLPICIERHEYSDYLR